MSENMHIDDPAALGRILTKLRAASGKSAREVADTAEVNAGSLLAWEKGNASPHLVSLIRVLRFYGETCTIGWDPPSVEREET